ncbi:MAG: TetR/AcrR family transcriptional regulator [Salinivirgaceae bacterium]|jgi:AcrR family transcriptional regulator|nr:TetR/AcrR family transcriptional regulator [Salinivirgaceae bacterium]
MQTERQAQIIEVAMNLIANKGIQGFTIKNLSKEIGISEPAIYRHYESKIDILINILNNFKEMSEMMSEMLVNNTDSALGKIDFMFSKMFEIFTEQPSIISVIFSEEIFKNEAILKEKIIEIQNIQQLNIENIIDKGQIEGNVRNDIDKSSLALIFMGSLRLLVKRWDLNNQSFSLKLEGKKLLKSFKILTVK